MRGGLLVVILYFDGFKVFRFEDLAAIETFNVVHAVSSGDHLGAVMFTSGMHRQRLDEIYSIRVQRVVKPPVPDWVTFLGA
jgi:hypothetical protein